MQIVWVSPFLKLQNNTTTIKRSKIRCRTHICFRLSCFLLLFWYPMFGGNIFSGRVLQSCVVVHFWDQIGSFVVVIITIIILVIFFFDC